MWVKICGITRYEDARRACELGADAVGFVLTPSRRRVEPGAVLPWIHGLEDIEKVGVFTDENPEEIARLGMELGLDTLQLHGQLSREHRALAERFSIIWATRGFCEEPIPRDIPCRVLIDPSQGSGTRGRWQRLDIPFILAGGLDPDNVHQAVRQAHPVGVDVSSGVEHAPGIKDAVKMERFIREARS